MYCRVLLLRVGGSRCADLKTVAGLLSSRPAGATLRVQITAPMAMRPLAELHDVRLVSLGEGGFVLRGYEDAGQRGVLQEWACTPVDTRHGFDATGQPLASPPFGDGA